MQTAKSPSKNRLNKFFLIIIAVGLLIISLMFVYYKFHLGVKPCSLDPAKQQFDASNCGDGDFGGLYFLIIGVPITIFGIVSLIASLVSNRFDKNYNEKRFLKLIAIFGAILIALVAVNLIPF